MAKKKAKKSSSSRKKSTTSKKSKSEESCCDMASMCCDSSSKCGKKWGCGGSGCGSYCLGFLGAAIYYIQTSNTFWDGVLGVLKALVWPLFLVYEALKFLGA